MFGCGQGSCAVGLSLDRVGPSAGATETGGCRALGTLALPSHLNNAELHCWHIKVPSIVYYPEECRAVTHCDVQVGIRTVCCKPEQSLAWFEAAGVEVYGLLAGPFPGKHRTVPAHRVLVGAGSLHWKPE